MGFYYLPGEKAITHVRTYKEEKMVITNGVDLSTFKPCILLHNPLTPCITSVYLTPTPTNQTLLTPFPPAHSLKPPQTESQRCRTGSQLVHEDGYMSLCNCLSWSVSVQRWGGGQMKPYYFLVT